jgi:hypothetical protein
MLVKWPEKRSKLSAKALADFHALKPTVAAVVKAPVDPPLWSVPGF